MNNKFTWIQILRAIAVILVVLYHINEDLMIGGYKGVDMFFVLSGFVISRSIDRECNFSNFNPYKFLSRRIWRILPAYIAMCIFLMVFALLILDPHYYQQIFKTIQWVILQISNYKFSSQLNYFDVENKHNPLLHTWSLSVECQFYTLFAFLIVLFKKKYLKCTLFILFSISIFLNYYYIDDNYSGKFFNLECRIWQFIVGIFLYIYKDDLSSYKKYRKINIFILILSLLVFSVVNLKNNLIFTDYQFTIDIIFTLSFCVLLLLPLNYKLWDSNLLKPIVYIGDVSYSIYLWHWPLISLRKIFQDSVYIDIVFLIIFVTLVLFSYYIIERKSIIFSNKIKEFNFISLLRYSVPLHILIVLFLTCLILKHSGNAGWRVANTELQSAQAESFKYQQSLIGNFIHDSNTSLILESNKNKIMSSDVLLVGDSHSIAISGHFFKKANDKDLKPYTFSGNSFYPFKPRILYIYNNHTPTRNIDYIKEQKRILDLLGSVRNKIIFFVLRMDIYTSFTLSSDSFTHFSFHNEKVNPLHLFIHNKSIIKNDIHDFINLIDKSNSLFFISQIPPLNDQPYGSSTGLTKLSYFIQKKFNSFFQPFRFSNNYLERLSFYDELIYSISIKYKNVTYINSSNIINSPYFNDILIYRDDDHLNQLGAKILVNYMFSFIP